MAREICYSIVTKAVYYAVFTGIEGCSVGSGKGWKVTMMLGPISWVLAGGFVEVVVHLLHCMGSKLACQPTLGCGCACLGMIGCVRVRWVCGCMGGHVDLRV